MFHLDSAPPERLKATVLGTSVGVRSRNTFELNMLMLMVT